MERPLDLGEGDSDYLIDDILRKRVFKGLFLDSKIFWELNYFFVRENAVSCVFSELQWWSQRVAWWGIKIIMCLNKLFFVHQCVFVCHRMISTNSWLRTLRKRQLHPHRNSSRRLTYPRNYLVVLGMPHKPGKKIVRLIFQILQRKFQMTSFVFVNLFLFCT